ncbi:MFS transporter [Streptomyces roseoverticillatus]|uniref:MFS transporter n=1 Tax=Streptomyces roseoverticillatus TaxID=66429 RepID=UPI001F285480|nr:MFS transporter [Streptomyces roseoverticillatus]MCF3101902.1 MFS transporter [Streptomyces roseoverticillatus]
MTDNTGAPAADPAEGGVLSPRYRALSLGLITSVTLVAFLWLGVATVLPEAAEDLGGVHLFGWAFTAFMLANLFGTIAAGQGADKGGPTRPYVQAFIVFVIGCVVAAVATNWWVLLAGRILQGLGVGGVLALAYLIVGLAYPDALRARMLALVASAWTLPALLGPAIAGAIASATNWRVVFLILVPLVPVAALLTLPAMRKLKPTGDGTPGENRLPMTVLLVLGVGALLAGLENRNIAVLVPLVVVGVAITLPMLNKLLPAGTLTVRRGMPAGMVVRGLVSAAYYGGESFFPLSMTRVLGLSTLGSGLALSAGALTWVSGAWLQAKLDTRSGGKGRHARVVLGFVLLVAGDALIALAVGTDLKSVPLAIVGWAVAGLGMGFVYPAVTTIVLSLAPKGKEGSASSSLQLCETLSVAVMTGLGTAITAYGSSHDWADSRGLGIIYVIAAVCAFLGIAAGLRTAVRRRTGDGDGGSEEAPAASAPLQESERTA